jgi:hypothetical protein
MRKKNYKGKRQETLPVETSAELHATSALSCGKTVGAVNIA